MKLQDSLDKLKIRIEDSLPVEYVNIMHQGTHDLEASGLGSGVLKVGDKAPEFILSNQKGDLISSKELLKKGPLVITYYRGIWCPYCNTDLANLKRYKDKIEAEGATMLSISPQKAAHNKQIIEQQGLNFDLLSDAQNNVAAQFGLRWEMVGSLRSLYNDQFKIDLSVYNGDDSWTLPIPARFIIGTDCVIKYAEFSIDYTKRPNPDVLLEVLHSIQYA